MGEQPKQVAVIGGGVAGLVCAHRLAQTGAIEPTVFEADDRGGGVLQTRREAGFLKECAANGMLSSAADGALELCRELDVPVSEVTRSASRRWIYLRGRLRALPINPAQMATSDLISWRAKLRLLAEPLAQRAPGGAEESVAEFVRRRLGDEVLHAVVIPFVTGIYAGDVEALSLAAAFPRLASLDERGGIALGLVLGMIDAARGLGAQPGPGRLWAPNDGMGAISTALSERLGPALKTSARVSSIAPDGERLEVSTSDGRRSSFDAAVLALPAPAAAAIVSPVSPELAEVLEQFEYAPIALVHLGAKREQVRHALDGFGFLVASGEDVRVLGCVFESVLWEGRAERGQVLLRCIFGGTRDPGVMDLDDEALVALARDEMHRLVGFEGEPAHASVVRWPRAVAQYNLGHLQRVDRAQSLARGRGIELAGSSYHGVSVNDCIANARTSALAVARKLGVAVAAAVCACLVMACSGKASKVAQPRDGGDDAAVTATDPSTPDGAAAPYTLASTDKAGTVVVKVEWAQPPASHLASPGRNSCGADQRPPVSVHTLGGLRSAIVEISGIDSGRAPDDPTPSQIVISDCKLDPPVVRVARLGGELIVSSADERRHDVIVEHLGDGSGDPVAIARLPLAIVGEQFALPTDRPGMLRLTSTIDAADHAYALVPSQPYVGITDDKGEVILEQVPPGTYTVRAWHRPLARGKPPLTASASITVESGKKASKTLSLAP